MNNEHEHGGALNKCKYYMHWKPAEGILYGWVIDEHGDVVEVTGLQDFTEEKRQDIRDFAAALGAELTIDGEA